MNHVDQEVPPLGGAIFDVEGVIAFPDRSALAVGLAALDPALTPEGLHALRHAPDLYPLWQAFSTGSLDADDYWSAVLRAAGLSAEPNEVAAIRDLQSRVTWARLDDGVLALADALRRAGLQTAILSNSAVDYEPQIGRFAHRFDRAHFSHRTGRRKPDPQSYLRLASELALDPAAILFIDDKQRNIEAARIIGMQSCLFRSAEQLRDVLLDLGALPA
ncbi:MAG: HAD-IA family hydrolase [Anaerolineae bacterium]